MPALPGIFQGVFESPVISWPRLAAKPHFPLRECVLFCINHDFTLKEITYGNLVPDSSRPERHLWGSSLLSTLAPTSGYSNAVPKAGSAHPTQPATGSGHC